MSNVFTILRTTVIEISLFFILLKKNEKGMSDFLLFYVCDALFRCRFVPLLAPNPGDATGIVDRR